MTGTEARFSLISGEGDGAMLGLAAGDSAGGAWELGYSAVTEQATVVAYQLIARGALEEEPLVASLLELDGKDGDEPVYRAETPHFRAWLDAAAEGGPEPQPGPCLDPAPRAVPVGVAFRRDPGRLVDQCLLLGRLFHREPMSLLAGVMAAGGVAAACFGQSGRDFIAGMAELLESTVGRVEVDEAGSLVRGMWALLDEAGVDDGDRALELAGAGGGSRPWRLLVAGLLLAAPPAERPHIPIAEAARIGGSPLGAMVGGMVGARVGIRAWPWAFANDTWFAEIGRRLVRGPNQVEDLPIPYAVEQHLITGEREGLV